VWLHAHITNTLSVPENSFFSPHTLIKSKSWIFKNNC
jgi:hypothetical protein